MHSPDRGTPRQSDQNPGSKTDKITDKSTESIDHPSIRVFPPTPGKDLNTSAKPDKSLGVSLTHADPSQKAETSPVTVDKPDSALKNFAVDTGSMLAFLVPPAIAIDMYMANATFTQAVLARFVALPVNLFTARPYGILRDQIFKKLGIDKDSSFLKKTITDTSIFVIARGSIYAGALAGTGYITDEPFTLSEILKATLTTSVALIALGRPYGWFRNKTRQLFGLKTVG